MFTQMTEVSAQSCHKLDSFRIMAIKKTVKVGLMNCQKFFFQMWKLFLFQRFGSSFFHSITVEEKKLLKKL